MLNVLLVDDDLLDRKDIRRLFERASLAAQLFEASDGERGLAQLRGDGPARAIPEPRVVLLDLRMPRMNGLEFLRAVRDDPKLNDTVIFVLTTSTSAQDLEAASQFSPAGYFVKSGGPDGPNGLLTQLKRRCQQFGLHGPSRRDA